MQTLKVPTASISDVKKSPNRIFEWAASAHNGVYIFNRGEVAGVMLTQEQYETLNDTIDALEDALHDAEVARRIGQGSLTTYPDEAVRGSASSNITIDDNDGWA
ncbi:MAG: type II toxin-antitoxin system Phd/YefM family antitoxin [Coriobacteriales bacterium]|jgi:PHD/YefM family antitoxin component YafN of YafNO toxin-antitoxin module|nr:type II toxin-antitoxin system Phd/YefM family antitoxin [Coriobacteriales bacterium]